MGHDHFYTLDFHGERAPSGGYQREGTTGYVYSTQQPGTVPIFRWFNPQSGDHFYTADPNGELARPTYRFEGIGWYMFSSPPEFGDTVPLYRWFNPSSGDHFYTTHPTGELAPQSGYRAEGVTGYLHPNEGAPQSVPLYRWYQTGLLSNFRFYPFRPTQHNPDWVINEVQQEMLRERHTWAYYRMSICDGLTNDEKYQLNEAYRNGFVLHYASQDSEVASSSRDELHLNFHKLFTLPEDEVAQILAHQMMHVAGYKHRKRHDPPGPFPDVPGDGGGYYGSTPLKAEMCIAGKQSDVICSSGIE
ncbi:hypothetical protein N7471_010371 [Penicillium samsonianum]|uniref:uncharacterized protein n=1 Tax=Penicillium samsonianum TaxID=1882272 RepID=UPI00254761E4|nr:uncharacterized protein N7471_010371 [Penicillium samsonianum]KAJ6125878.1 hypothetical protein N7471_010371 [Penicillium samsonianum]